MAREISSKNDGLKSCCYWTTEELYAVRKKHELVFVSELTQNIYMWFDVVETTSIAV